MRDLMQEIWGRMENGWDYETFLEDVIARIEVRYDIDLEEILEEVYTE